MKLAAGLKIESLSLLFLKTGRWFSFYIFSSICHLIIIKTTRFFFSIWHSLIKLKTFTIYYWRFITWYKKMTYFFKIITLKHDLYIIFLQWLLPLQPIWINKESIILLINMYNLHLRSLFAALFNYPYKVSKIKSIIVTVQQNID